MVIVLICKIKSRGSNPLPFFFMEKIWYLILARNLIGKIFVLHINFRSSILLESIRKSLGGIGRRVGFKIQSYKKVSVQVR